MTVSCENLQPCCIAYIRSVGPYGAANGAAMERLKEWAAKNGLLGEDAIILGIAQDTPETTEPECCRYDACVVVHEDYAVSGNAVCRGSIEGGRYAVFRIEHTATAMQRAWAEIFPAVIERGWQPDGTRPIMERYPVKLVQEHECEICLPIR